jgi:EpsI family protein
MLEAANGTHRGALAAVDGANGWRAEPRTLSTWRPEFQNPELERHQTFARDGQKVGLYIGYYRQQSQESELVTSGNQLVGSINKRWLKAADGQHEVRLGGDDVRVRTAELVGDGTRFQAWQWYWINGRITASDHVAKFYGALDRLSGRGDDSAVVVVYTPMSDARDTQAAATLAAFVSDMAPAIEARLNEARGQ